jgi:hypothetical protein
MTKEYIGSQEHFEDEVNAYYDQKEEMEKQQKIEYEKQYIRDTEEEYRKHINNQHPIMTDVEFCEIYSSFSGEKITDTSQIVSVYFSGETLIELARHIEHCLRVGSTNPK